MHDTIWVVLGKLVGIMMGPKVVGAEVDGVLWVSYLILYLTTCIARGKCIF
jgi:hypothetical protein